MRIVKMPPINRHSFLFVTLLALRRRLHTHCICKRPSSLELQVCRSFKTMDDSCASCSQAETLHRGIDTQPGQIGKVARELLIKEVLIGRQFLHNVECAVIVCQGLVRAEKGISQDDLLVVLAAEIPGIC